jgi:hypothetical protein
MATKALVNANEFIGSSAKMGALLRYVYETGERPHGLNPGTLQVWEAMVFLDIVDCGCDNRVWLSEGAKELLKLADHGEA